MGLADAAVRAIGGSEQFASSASPYLLLDARLRIRAANGAYQRATHHRLSDIVGELMFDVFPDNPATPEARSVDRLGRSLDQVLATGARHRMPVQRYDVLTPGGFVEKSWLPVNTPLRDGEGLVVGVLHHVEDVTHLVADTALERHLVHRSELVGQDAGTRRPDVVAALARDAASRRMRADLLIHGSRRAIERMASRIGPYPYPADGFPASSEGTDDA